MSPEDPGELELKDYAQILRRRWLVASVLLVLCVGGATAFSLLQAERYGSSATVIVRTPRSQNLFVSIPSSSGLFNRDLVSELSLAESDAYRPEIDSTINLSASNPEDTSELEFTAEAPTAGEAEAAAQAWAELYIEGRQSFDLASATAAITTAEQSIADVRLQEEELQAPLEPIEAAIERATDPDVISRLTTQRLSLLQALDADLFPLRSQRQSLSSELGRQRTIVRFLEDTPELSARLVSVSDARDLRSPLSRNIALGGVVGVILASAGALLVENLRQRIQSVDDLHRAVPGITVLGELPEVDSKLLGPGMSWEGVSSDPAYRSGLETVITSLQVIARDQPFASLMVTSADEATGKSSVVSSLGLAMAREGESVVIVDGDLRRPRLNVLFDLEDRPGVTNVLQGTCDVDSVVRRLPEAGVTGLSVVACGSPAESPAELLRSPRLGDAVDKLTRSHNLAIVDSPPLLPVTDASLISSAVDLSIVVVRAGLSSPDAVRSAVETLRRTNTEPVAIVVGTDVASSYY